MRRKTEKEKKVIGRVEAIFRVLKVKKTSRGFSLLVDFICYAYAFPSELLEDIVKRLEIDNYYVGIIRRLPGKTNYNENDIISSMFRCVEAGIERANKEDLQKCQLNKLKVIFGDNPEEELLEEIGEKYAKYDYQEQVVFYFVKKILKIIQPQQ